MSEATVYMAFIFTAEETEIMIYAIEDGKLRIIELLPLSRVSIEEVEEIE